MKQVRNKILALMMMLPGQVSMNVGKIGTIDPGPDMSLLMARLINSEGDGEPFAGKLAIGEVAMQIAKCKKIPLLCVITDSKIFHGIINKKYTDIPGPENHIAANIVLSGYNALPENVLYYYNPRGVKNWGWIEKIAKYRHAVIGRHVFCYDPEYPRA